MGLFDDIFNPSGPYRQQLAGTNGVGQRAEGVAGTALGFGNQQAGYSQEDQNALNAQRTYLQGLMSGQNSVAAQQLKQGLQQSVANQQAMAASASPNNAAMAARNAASNMGAQNMGLSGQQAIAGLQERNQAASQLASLNLGALGTNTSGALGGFGAANQGLGVAGNAFGAAMGNPGTTPANTIANTALGVGGALLMSDERAKKNIRDGAGDANKVMAGLKQSTYEYKDARRGAGKQLGVTAQSLERAGLKSAVVDTRAGKMVDAGKLAGANTAMIASLHQRLSKVENDNAKLKAGLKKPVGKSKRDMAADDDDVA